MSDPLSVRDPLSLGASDVETMSQTEAEQVLNAWVKAHRTELPAALVRSKVKSLARLAKRALYQLRSSGLLVEVAPPLEETEAPVPVSGPEEGPPGLLSTIEGTGEREMLFSRRISGEFRAFHAMLSDEHGVLEIEAVPTRRRAFRDLLKEAETHPDLMMRVDWPRIKLELGRALALSERGAALSVDDATVLRMLEIDPVDPEWALPPLEPDDSQAARRSASLAQERELASWLPSENAIAELATTLEVIEASPLVLSEAQKREHAFSRARAAAASYLTPKHRQIYGRRLWAMAELFEHSARSAQAALARAEARLLFHTAEPSAFVEAMFAQIVDLRLAAPRAAPPVAPDGPAPQPSSLVRP